MEAEPAALEGRILLGDRDTFYLANADGSAVERLADPSQYCCLARISPDHSRILTMPGTDQTGAVMGGTLTLQQPVFDLFPSADPTLNLVPQTWSPDGTRIAFEGWDDSDPNRTGIYTARSADGTDMTQVTTVTGRARAAIQIWSIPMRSGFWPNAASTSPMRSPNPSPSSAVATSNT